jgi:hypothetical protein
MSRTPVEEAFAGALRAVNAPAAAHDLFAAVQGGVRRRVRRRRATALAVLAAVAVAPLAVNAGGASGPEPARTADAVQVLRAGGAADGGGSGRYWSTLRGVLPNVTYTYDSAGRQMREQVTDSAVVGRVIAAEPARGMLPEPLKAGDDVRTRVVAFDDPRAAWRVLSVTVEVSETLAGRPVGELELDWVVLGSSQRGEDAEAVERALKDLGTLVVLSKASPSRPEFVPGRSALSSGYGIGRVGSDGRLDFPLISQQEAPSAAAFQEDLDTLDELRAEASKPTRTETLVPEAQ